VKGGADPLYICGWYWLARGAMFDRWRARASF